MTKTTTAIASVLVVVALAGVGQAASPSPDTLELPTTDAEDCTGVDDVAELCQEHSLGSYCAWIEVLGSQLDASEFCIYWPA